MDAKHTPGPWSVGEKVGTLVFAGNEGSMGDFICEVTGEDETPRAVNRANARLIAAAPELLSALYELDGAAEYMDFDPESRFGLAVEKARTAIAKATGAAQ